MPKETFTVYSTSVTIDTPLERFSGFVRANYEQFLPSNVTEPDISVLYSEKAGQRADELKSDLRYFGGGIYLGDESLYWENEFGFRVHVSVNTDGTLTVRSFHDDLLNKTNPEERFKDFQRSMRWAIHFPLFTRLQYQRDWVLVHASAVSKNGNAVVFCGLNKVGKSTLAVYLAQERGYDLMTDNFLFVGENKLYGFPEVVRLSPAASDRFELSSVWDELVYGKHHVNPGKIGVSLESEPKAFFMVNQADELVTRKLPSTAAWETMQYLHSYLGEFPEQSYFGFWPYLTGQTMDKTAATESVTNVPWYELSYEPTWNLDAVATEVEQCI